MAAAAAAPASQEDLIMQQFGAAKRQLQQKQMAGQQDLQGQMDRQQAITGLSGGAAEKAKNNALKSFNIDSMGQDASLDQSQAQALQGVAATKQAQQYATSERLGSQDFAGQQSQLQRNQSQNQFVNSLNLQRDQFKASQDQFGQQLKYQWTEFTENQKTNFINAITAFKKAGINNIGDSLAAFNPVDYARGMTQYYSGNTTNASNTPSYNPNQLTPVVDLQQ